MNRMWSGMKKVLPAFLAVIMLVSIGLPVYAKASTVEYQGSRAYFYDRGESGQTYRNDDDGISDPISLGFDFKFYGQSYEQAYLTPNGYMMFDISSTEGYAPYNNAGELPLTRLSNYIAPFFEDLELGDGDVLYKTIGDAPNRKFIAQWTNIVALRTGQVLGTFQAILYESTNAIQFQYVDFKDEDEDEEEEEEVEFDVEVQAEGEAEEDVYKGESALIGLQYGDQYTLYSRYEASVVEGQAIRFTWSEEDSEYIIDSEAAYDPVSLFAAELAAPTLVSPRDGAIVSSSPILRWQAVPGAIAYAAAVFTDPELEEFVTATETEVLDATTFFQPTDLDEGTYYWIAVAFDGFDVAKSEVRSFTVSSVLPSDASLSSLDLSGITLETVTGSVYDYTATVPNSITVTSATYETSDSEATAVLKYNGEPTSNPISLSVGSNNNISVEVTAQDNSVQVYNVVVSRLANTGGGSVPTPTPTPTPTETASPTPKPEEPSIFSDKVDYAAFISYWTKQILLLQSGSTTIELSDIANHWANTNIVLAARLGVVSGYEDGSFKPNGSITRAEFASMIAKVFNLQASSAATGFSDADSHWAKQAISALASSGVINGYENGTFRPDSTITRAEIIAIISRLANLEKVKVKDAAAFTDIADSWNKEEIEAAYKAGIVEGRMADQFAPNASSTRAEALTLILRVLELDPTIKAFLDKAKASL